MPESVQVSPSSPFTAGNGSNKKKRQQPPKKCWRARRIIGDARSPDPKTLTRKPRLTMIDHFFGDLMRVDHVLARIDLRLDGRDLDLVDAAGTGERAGLG